MEKFADLARQQIWKLKDREDFFDMAREMEDELDRMKAESEKTPVLILSTSRVSPAALLFTLAQLMATPALTLKQEFIASVKQMGEDSSFFELLPAELVKKRLMLEAVVMIRKGV